jgi:hypothetical protein
VIDRFYAVLGPRNWIVHDALPMPLLQAIGGMAAEDAERRLIGYYQDPENLERLTRRLSHPELRVQSPLTERAKTEFLSGRYNTCVLLLLSVMDGFVNDVDASRRRGLHARDPEEMVAWDSVVGHHMGLAHAHASFTKTFKKTSTDEIREPYRHGIVNGMLVNYDNEYVGAKAWNRLCAVRDWVTSMRRLLNRRNWSRASWKRCARSTTTGARGKRSMRGLRRWSVPAATDLRRMPSSSHHALTSTAGCSATTGHWALSSHGLWPKTLRARPQAWREAFSESVSPATSCSGAPGACSESSGASQRAPSRRTVTTEPGYSRRPAKPAPTSRPG